MDGHGRNIDLQISKPQNFGLFRRLRFGAKHGPNAGDQFAGAEGFGDVVVAPEFEPLHAISFGCFRAQENDGNPGECRSLPDLSAQLKTVHSGQHDIQKNNAGSSRPASLELRRGGEGVNFES